MLRALISNIQKYSLHDGPGIRSTVFFKGCPLLCAWCHNPESQIFEPEILWKRELCIGCLSCRDACPRRAITATEGGLVIDRELCDCCQVCSQVCPSLAMERLGREYSLDQLLAELDKDQVFYEQSGGGITLSGGEPLSQSEFALALLRACRQRGYHTAVDTCGFVPQAVLEAALPFTDLFLYDLKLLDEAAHQQWTQAPNAPILRNLSYLAGQGANIWLRVPLIPTVNDDPQQLRAIGRLALELQLRQIYLLPYHKLAQSKYQRLGLNYRLPQLDDISQEQAEPLAQILREMGIEVHIGG